MNFRTHSSLNYRTPTQKFLLWTVSLALLGVYASISLVNHYLFRTHAYDLGWYNKVFFDYSHFRLCDFSLGYWRTALTCPLGDHFEPILLLLAPLRLLFGSWTAILLQIAAILFGAYGAYRFVEERSGNSWLPLLAMLQFGLIWGNFGALSFDYHNNVLAAMLLPWFLHHFLAGRWKKSLIYFILAIMCKENMALWMAATAAGAALLNLKNRRQFFQGMALALGAGIYFVIVVKWMIPWLSGGVGSYIHFKYHGLGENMGEVLRTLLTDPLKALRLFWENPSGNPAWNGAKGEVFKMMLWSGGIALLLRPQYLLMLLPVMAQKFWHDEPEKWGLSHHYSIEFVPVLTLATWDLILKIPRRRVATGLGLLAVGFTLWAAVYWFEYRKPLNYFPETTHFYARMHYQQPLFEPAEAYEALKLIPAESKVSAQNTAVPHLAMRKYIYLFPRVEDAEYIFLLNTPEVYPASPDEYKRKVEEFRNSVEWEVLKENKSVLLFKKRKAVLP
ncbi:MAG: DUF2079 domain-containing protein [Bacteroidia bacterium]|nr:DUF2079 domain-containing protein [Bacteroidia bacterium]